MSDQPDAPEPAPRPPSRPAPNNESLSQLAGGFAHDLNNLLTGILSSVALVRAAQLAEEPTEPYLEQIETAALCAGDLCRQVLARAGRGALVSERVHVSQLVAQILPLVQLALGGRARLTLQLADELPLVVADGTQLRQVMLNLVANAAEAILTARRHDGELIITTRSVMLDDAALRAAYAAPDAAPGRHVSLLIRDNGIGIPPEVLGRVFEPFFTTKPSDSPTSRGLGLAIVLGVVRGHRGVLQVRSSVGQGTEFELLFPSFDPAAPQAAAIPHRLIAPDHTILVIDDEPTVREFVSRVLRNAGYRVIGVSSGKEAVAQFGAAGPRVSLVIVDWSLGPGDGELLVRQLHRQRPGVPLVIISGYAPAEYAQRLHGVPLAGTLQKPFRVDALLNLVRRILH